MMYAIPNTMEMLWFYQAFTLQTGNIALQQEIRLVIQVEKTAAHMLMNHVVGSGEINAISHFNGDCQDADIR